MASKVYFADLRTDFHENLQQKLTRLLKAAGMDSIDFDRKYVAIKMHFGEPGNLAFLRPNFAKTVVDAVNDFRSGSGSSEDPAAAGLGTNNVSVVFTSVKSQSQSIAFAVVQTVNAADTLINVRIRQRYGTEVCAGSESYLRVCGLIGVLAAVNTACRRLCFYTAVIDTVGKISDDAGTYLCVSDDTARVVTGGSDKRVIRKTEYRAGALHLAHKSRGVSVCVNRTRRRTAGSVYHAGRFENSRKRSGRSGRRLRNDRVNRAFGKSMPAAHRGKDDAGITFGASGGSDRRIKMNVCPGHDVVFRVVRKE